MKALVVDALARGEGAKYATVDVVGAGPRVVAGLVKDLIDVNYVPYEVALTHELARYDYLLISAMISDLGAVNTLVERANAKGFRGKVILGGPVSFGYWEILFRMRRVDYVLIGEAEIPLPILIKTIGEGGPIEKVPALAYRAGETIKVTSSHIHTPKEIISSVKPWTEVDKSYDKPQIYRFYVEVVRGCSNFYRPMIRGIGGLNCTECGNCRSKVLKDRVVCPAWIPPGCGFCSVPYMFGPPRSRSVKSVTMEVEELIAHGARRIVLSGPDFLDYGRDEIVNEPLTDPCNPPPNVEAIEELLNMLYTIPEIANRKAVVMIENIKACLVDEDVARLLGKYLSGTTVHIGMETGNDFFNEKVLGKPIGVRDVLRATKLLSKNGLRPYVYLMYGLPLMDKAVYADTLNIIGELAASGVEKITLYKFTPLPGTGFEKMGPEVSNHREEITLLKRRVESFNFTVKRKMVGQIVEAYLYNSEGKCVAYPLQHGPVIFLTRSDKCLGGCRALVKIVDIGVRKVIGRTVKVIEC
mgnify:CR=1 FL=1